MERRIVLNLCGAVYTMNADGTGLARLTNHGAADAFPTWSPDGGRIGREPWVIACSARRGRLVKATTMPGHLAATGKAEIALHQMQELMAVPGIEIVGPLPGDLQGTFLFSAAVMADAKDVKAARALVEFLRTPAAKAVIKAKGMDPALP